MTARLFLAALLLFVGLSAPSAQLSLMGVGPASSGTAAPASCTSGSLMTGVFDLTNTCNDIYFIGGLK